jgi:hypothetical protein
MQEITKSIPFPILIILLTTITLGGIWHFNRKLAERHASDVRIIWYLLFLSLIASAIAAEWGTSIGAIDEKGSFHGPLGSVIDSLLKFMLSLNEDIKVFSTILAIVIGPQIGSYIFSGIVGCATAPILVGRSFSLFTWAIVKSFVSAAGVLMALSIYGGANNWSGWNFKGATTMAAMSLMLLLVSFYMLAMYREITHQTDKAGSIRYEKLRRRVAAWMSRNVHNEA